MRVALATGAPVIPIVVRGTEKVNPSSSRRWHFGKVSITVCEPLDLSDYRGRADERPAVRAATDKLMHALAAVSGQEYVDEYARRPQ